MMRSFGRILIFSSAMAFAAPAAADVLAFSSNRKPQTFLGGAGLLVLDDLASGAKTISVTSRKETDKILITFTAECSIAGDANSWVDLDIQIKRPSDESFASLPPTDDDYAFCSGARGSLNVPVAVSQTVGAEVPMGVSLVRVRVRAGAVSGGDGRIRFDDTFISVQN